MDAVIPDTFPVNVGFARLAFKSRAVCWGVLTGLLASVVLSTLLNPTMDLVMPDTVLVKLLVPVHVLFRGNIFVLLPSVYAFVTRSLGSVGWTLCVNRGNLPN